MGKRIKWDYEMSNEKIIESEKNIIIFEENNLVVFPKRYKKIVLNYSNATPEIEHMDNGFVQGLIKFPNGFCPEGISFLSFFNQEIKGNITNRMAAAYKYTRNILMDKVFPFAETGAGDLYLFDFTGSNDNPKVYFIEHGNMCEKSELSEQELEGKSIEEFIYDNMIFLAETFDELLELIIPDEE